MISVRQYSSIISLLFTCEPQHDKTNKMSVRPAKTQISLGIRPVWSVSSLCTQWVAKNPSFLHAESEDSDQNGQTFKLQNPMYMSHVMRKTVYALCKHQSCRSACASEQSDQHLCCLLPRQYIISSFHIRNFKPLASFYNWAGWFEPYLVANPEDKVFSWHGSYTSTSSN